MDSLLVANKQNSSMSERVHYLPVWLDYEHLLLPITMGELEASQIVLLVPNSGDMTSAQEAMVEGNSRRLEREFGHHDISVSQRTVNPYEFPELYQTAYSDIWDQLTSGRKVYLNVSAMPRTVGYAYWMAANTLVMEHTLIESFADEPPISDEVDLRNDIHVYCTVPDNYLTVELISKLEDLQQLFNQQSAMLGFLETTLYRSADLTAAADTLADDGRWETTLTEVSDLEDGIEQSEAEELAEGITHLFEGIEAVGEGLEKLAAANTEEIPSDQLTHGEDFRTLVGGASSFVEDIDEDVLTSAGLIGHIQSRMQQAQTLLNQYSNQIDQTLTEINDEIQDIDQYGVSRGARTFTNIRTGETRRYQLLPHPLNLDLPKTSWTVIYTMYYQLEMEEASINSIAELTECMIDVALRLCRNEAVLKANGSDLSPSDVKAAIRGRESSEPDDSELFDSLDKSLRSKVQYNVTQLDEKGFLRKEKQGRSYAIDFTYSGLLWTQAKELQRDLEEFDETGYSDDLLLIFDTIIDKVIDSIESDCYN